jgi:hypothetical protein
MSRKFTVEKEAEYRWIVLDWDNRKVQGPYRFKKEAAAVAELYNQILKDPDTGVGAHSSNTISANNNPKNAALPPAPAHQQSKKTTVAGTPTPEPAQLRCVCGWLVVPEAAYKHFQDCPPLGEL